MKVVAKRRMVVRCIVVGGWVDCWKALETCELGFGGRFVGLSFIVRLGTTARSGGCDLWRVTEELRVYK